MACWKLGMDGRTARFYDPASHFTEAVSIGGCSLRRIEHFVTAVLNGVAQCFAYPSMALTRRVIDLSLSDINNRPALAQF
jgi:hypothetical protein